MDVLRSCVSSFKSVHIGKNKTKDDFLENGIKLISQIPIVIAAHQRIRNNLSPIKPNISLIHSANWLYMLNGQLPTKENEKLTDLDLI